MENLRYVVKALANIESVAEAGLTLLLLQEHCLFSVTERQVSQQGPAWHPGLQTRECTWTRHWIRHWLDGCTLESCCQWLHIQMETSGKCCPQGWVFALVLFNNIAGTMDSGTECTLSKVADDTLWATCWREDTPSRRSWTGLRGGSLTKFNNGNCKVLYLNWGSSKHKFRLGRE